jgi:lipopolysaccharide export system permease protein
MDYVKTNNINSDRTETDFKAETKPLIDFKQNVARIKPANNTGNQFVKRKKSPITSDSTKKILDSIFAVPPSMMTYQSAANMARQVKAQISSTNQNLENFRGETKTFAIHWHKIISNSIACIAMFLIGAPLGSIIKRGGLGIPFLVSIFFFIVFYLLNMQGEKWVNQDLVAPVQGIWTANFVLFIIGFFFLRQARIDARLFDADVYLVFMERLKRRFFTKK